MNKLAFTFFTMTSSLLFCNTPWESYKQDGLQHQHLIAGWCSREKAEKMMDLILETQTTICVEIGVFGGASIYPTALALNYRGAGVVYAIDPWATAECTKGYEPDHPNYHWWNQVNLEQVFQGFKHMLNAFSLNPYCHILRMTALEALSTFEDNSIDILHIDGNHTEASALADIQLYFPKVKSGGYIWFDDANWPTTQKGLAFLLNNDEVVKEKTIEGEGTCCVLFRKKPRAHQAEE